MNTLLKKYRKYCLYIIIFIINYIYNYITPSVLYGDDDVFMHAVERQGGVFQWIKYYYLNWSGRILPHSALVLLINAPKVLFDILNALALTLMLIMLVKVCLIGVEGAKRIGWLAVPALWLAGWFLVDKEILTDAVLWKTASVLYVWGMCAGFAALLPYVRAMYGIGTSKRGFAGSLLCGLYASNVEQIAVFMVASALVMTIIVIARNDLNVVGLVVSLVCMTAGTLISLLAPGNQARHWEDVLCVIPYYDMASFPERINSAFAGMLGYINDYCMVLYFVVAILLCLILFLRPQIPLIARLCAVVAALYSGVACFVHLVEGVLGDGAIIPEWLDGVKQWLYNYGLVHEADFIVKRTQAFSLFMGMLVFWLLVLLILMFVGDGLEWISFLFFGGAAGTVFMLGFTPAGSATGVRACFPMIVMMFGVLLRLAAILIHLWKSTTAKQSEGGSLV